MRDRLRIAVCEDQEAERRRLIRAARESLAALSIRIDISEFTSGEALMAAFKPGLFDVLFLDIYMGGITGMEVARAIRKHDRQLPIVFTTVSKEFAVESYEVRAAHYLIKPVLPADMGEVWSRLFREREMNMRVTLMVDRKPVDVLLTDVLYAEADNKRCRLHLRDGIIDTRLSIEQLQQLLPEPPFCRCHRGYIVNFEHVRTAGDDFLMKNGELVYIRQAEREPIREAYFLYLVEKARQAGTETMGDVL